MADISINLDNVKPLLSSLGLGQAPPAPPKVDQLPAPAMPPAPPPPTPAIAGFSQWMADPRTQQKVASGVTLPGTPLMPAPAPMAAVNPPQQQYAALNPPGAPPAPASPAAPAATLAASPAPLQRNLQADQNELRRLQTTGSGISQIKNPWLRALGTVGDIASSITGLGGAIPGTTLHNRTLQTQQAQTVGSDEQALAQQQGAIQAAAQLADTQSQTNERTAKAARENAQADSSAPFVMTKEQAEAISQPALAGTQTTMRDYTKALTAAGNNATSITNNQNTNTTKVTTTGLNNDAKASIEKQREAARAAIADAANKTKVLVTGMNNSTSRANNADTNASRGTVAGGGYKVPADVTKRAALASNVLENADAVDSVLQRAPDIVGSMGGRYSNVQQMIGSDDPNIQELGVRMHNIALASNGAHGVRSAQAIQKTEDELFNNFKSGPNGIRGALGATRGSMQTFLNDEKNFAASGSRTGGIAQAPTGGSGSIPPQAAAQLQEGVIHTFGNGQQWTKQNGKPVRVK